MTVERLIEWLKQRDPKSEIVLYDQNTEDMYYILAIAEVPDNTLLMFNTKDDDILCSGYEEVE